MRTSNRPGSQDTRLPALPCWAIQCPPWLTSVVGSAVKAAVGVEAASTTGGGAMTAGLASVSSAESSPLLESLPSAPVGKPMSCNTWEGDPQDPCEGWGSALGHSESEVPRVAPSNFQSVVSFCSPHAQLCVDTFCLSAMLTKAFLPHVT